MTGSRRHAAAHEGIHLVLAWRLGLVITMATIDPALAAKIGGASCYGLVKTELTGAQTLRDPLESLQDRAAESLGPNFTEGVAWSERDWWDARGYADKAWARAGDGRAADAWKDAWLNGQRRRARSIVLEPRSVRAFAAVSETLLKRETIDGTEAVWVMESA
jgi:hypothetical protein